MMKQGDKTIWKYVLKTIDEQELEIPYDSKLLDLQVQHGVPCLWVMVDPNEIKLKRKIFIYGTGHTIPSRRRKDQYLGSYQLDGGSLVFHAFMMNADTTLLLRDALKKEEQ